MTPNKITCLGISVEILQDRYLEHFHRTDLRREDVVLSEPSLRNYTRKARDDICTHPDHHYIETVT